MTNAYDSDLDERVRKHPSMQPATDATLDRSLNESVAVATFDHPTGREIQENARHITKQIVDSYNAGDPDTVEAVRNYEAETLKRGRTPDYSSSDMFKRDLKRYGSGDKMIAGTQWDIYYDAEQRYIGDALMDPKKMLTIPQEHRQDLAGHYGFDMAGRTQFDFRPVLKSGKIKAKGTMYHGHIDEN